MALIPARIRNGGVRGSRRAVAVLALLAFAVWSFGAAPHAYAESAAVKSAALATVAIYDSTEEVFGSGVIISPGWVITAGHVADYADSNRLDLLLKTQDGREHGYTIEEISDDPDLALLRVVDLTEAPGVPFGSAGQLSTGDDVYALGYPLGLTALSVTKGVVSALLQTVDGSRYLQTDASINPGNSGGPLIDAQGRLVGINVAKADMPGVDNIGFAVPIETVSGFLEGTAAGGLELSAASGSSSAAGSGGGAQPDGSGTFLVALLIIGGGLIGYVTYSANGSRPAQRQAFGSAVPVAQPAVDRSGVPHAFAVRLMLEGPTGRSETSATLPAVIGRSSSADVAIGDAQASRHHARLSGDAAGVTVQDLTSRNGTLVDGVRKASFDLSKGTSFRIGETTVTRIG